MKPFNWIYNYFYKWKKHFLIAVIGFTLANIVGLLNPYIMGRVSLEVFENNDYDKLLPYIAFYVSMNLIRTIVNYICQCTIEKFSQNVVMDLRTDMYKKVQRQSFEFYDNNKVGDIMSRMTGDLESIRHFCANVMNSALQNTVVFVFGLGFMLFVSWQLTLILISVAPFICILTIKQSKELKEFFTQAREQFSKLNTVCEENISGNRVVKAFTREKFELDKFTKQNQEYYSINVELVKAWMKFMPIQDFVVGSMQVLLILFGGLLVINGQIQIWHIITISGYMWVISNPMRTYGWLMNDIQRFFASLDKIHAMMREGIKIKDCEEPIVIDKMQGEIEFKNVSFAYDGASDKNVLEDLTFKIKSGQTFGIVGATGSGKTTLVNLVSRFYDATEGEIFVDNVNVKNIQLNSLRKNVSYAMQDVFLFSDTVEGNLAYGVPEEKLEDLYQYSVSANAHEFILKMEEGYDTIVGERGVGLSGGQKQRLSLARALASQPSILILDDTTSAVDMETEHEIQTALKENNANTTTIIIAHRISSVKPADCILVLERGKIIERGNHDELVAMRGKYYNLFMEQYSDLLAEMKGGENIG